MRWMESYNPQEMQALLAETHYHLGRVLCEGELDFDRAVSELEEAVRLDPENIRAHYHLGQAIRNRSSATSSSALRRSCAFTS